MSRRVRDILFERSPYEDLNLDGVKPDLQGWGSDHVILKQAVETMKPSLVIEVGSWKGRSAINMARACKDAGVDCEIVCVDTWLGSPEHWINRENSDAYESLRISNGRPELYKTFLRNVVSEGMENAITPFPSTSDVAFHVLARYKVRADIIYVDAGHEYENVKSDLINYWKLLKGGGVMIGDDYSARWPGVIRACREFAEEMEVQEIDVNGKVAFYKWSPDAAIPSFLRRYAWHAERA